MEKKKCIIVNFFGGPSTCKTTTAHGLTYKLMMNGINCEYVPEYAKHVVWKENYTTLKNQLYVFGKQHDRLFHIKEKVDVIITDSPIILGLSYCNFDVVSPSLIPLILDEFNRPESVNLNYVLKRIHPYSTKGRYQDEAHAIAKDKEIIDLLNKYNVQYHHVEPDDALVSGLYIDVIAKLLVEQYKNA